RVLVAGHRLGGPGDGRRLPDGQHLEVLQLQGLEPAQPASVPAGDSNWRIPSLVVVLFWPVAVCSVDDLHAQRRDDAAGVAFPAPPARTATGDVRGSP